MAYCLGTRHKGGLPMKLHRPSNLRLRWTGFIVLTALACSTIQASAAQCGNSSSGFEAWKQQFAPEARAKGIGQAGISALMQTNYNQATINADRGQRSFRLSLEEFLAKRGGAAIVSRGRTMKQTHAALFASIEQRYGVPPGPLIAIWGMETAFGSQRGKQSALSAVATLAYDCRRPEYFTDQLMAALKLVDRGLMSASTIGSMHGEIGQTQFMPKAILNYGSGNLDVAANALDGLLLDQVAHDVQRMLAVNAFFAEHPSTGTSRAARAVSAS